MTATAATPTVARVNLGSPTAALAHGPADDETAVRRDLIEQFMGDSALRMWMSLASTLGIVAIAWNYADRRSLLAWLAAGVAVFVGFWIVERPYQRSRRYANAQDQQRMLRVLAPLYLARGMYWGTPLLLFFMVDTVPRPVQTGCALIALAMTSEPLASLALVPRLCRLATHALFGTSILCFLWRVAQRHGLHVDQTFLFVLIPFIHWGLMARLSERVYRNHRKMCVLQLELVRKEQEARHAIEVKNRLLATAAHDIRQPVSALSLLTHHLVHHPDMHLELAPKIAQVSASLNQLFDALFEHSALESGAVSVAMQDVDLGHLLDSLRVEFEPQAGVRGIALRVRSLRLGVRTDPMRLRRIVGNLLSNALKYSPPDRSILLTARVRRGVPCVEVWDQGVGIPSRELGNIFQAFYRVDLSEAHAEVRDRARSDGIGLGLSIVARLSQMMDIGIEVKSSLGRGTRITLALPGVASAALG
ncbi:MAG: HAMP domain-containing histidine kinase [Proteobacteria bacterium]|nr:HAMP domain-containing histidine kinase [Pseudomonadota bacterium]